MSNLVNLFINSKQLHGSKNYNAWINQTQSTLIYNELWKDVCIHEKDPIKHIDVR